LLRNVKGQSHYIHGVGVLVLIMF